jgi:hypothetical protein
MLFNRRALEGIAAGDIDLAFRRWKRPTVKAGGTLRTRAGVLAIDSVERIGEWRIDGEQARRAGFASKRELLDSLRPEGRLHRVRFHRIGEDPRVALRKRERISHSERAELDAGLARMDRARGKPWTRRVLELIGDHPETPAAELAASMGVEKLPFKRDVRKLKELGLTESLPLGYRLSPRGRAYLRVPLAGALTAKRCSSTSPPRRSSR